MTTINNQYIYPPNFNSISNNFTDFSDFYNNFESITDNVIFGVTFSFAIGMVFSPLNKGLLYLIIGYILWEMLIFCCVTRWQPFKRILYIIAAFIGFYVGRKIIGDRKIFRLVKNVDQYYFIKP